MSENVIIVKKVLFIKNNDGKHQPKISRSFLKVHKPNQNPQKLHKPSKFQCWTCGLSKSDEDYCKKCNKCIEN